MTLLYDIETLSDSVDPADLDTVRQDVRKIRQTLDVTLYQAQPAHLPVSWAEINWPLTVSGSMTLIVAIVAAVGIARRGRSADLSVDDTAQPRPIGGWLALMGIGVVINPFAVAFNARHLLTLNAPLWSTITTPGAVSYNPIYAPMVLFEVCTNVLLLVGSVLVAILFFQHRRVFRPAYIILWGGTIGVLALDAHLAQQLRPQPVDGAGKFVGPALGALIWGIYLYRSKRARSTFIR